MDNKKENDVVDQHNKNDKNDNVVEGNACKRGSSSCVSELNDDEQLDHLRQLDYARFNYGRNRLSAVRAERLGVISKVNKNKLAAEVTEEKLPYNCNNNNSHGTEQREYDKLKNKTLSGNNEGGNDNINNSSNISHKDSTSNKSFGEKNSLMKSQGNTSEMDSAEEEIERKIAEKERLMKMRARYSRALRVNQAHDDRTVVDKSIADIKNKPKIIGNVEKIKTSINKLKDLNKQSREKKKQLNKKKWTFKDCVAFVTKVALKKYRIKHGLQVDTMKPEEYENEAQWCHYRELSLRSQYPPMQSDCEPFETYLELLDSWCDTFVPPICRYIEEPGDFRQRKSEWQRATQRPTLFFSKTQNEDEAEVEAEDYVSNEDNRTTDDSEEDENGIVKEKLAPRMAALQDDVMMWVCDRQIPTAYDDEPFGDFERRLRNWCRLNQPHRRYNETIDEFYDRLHEWRSNCVLLPRQYEEEDRRYKKRVKDLMALIAPPLPRKRQKPSHYLNQLETWRDRFVPPPQREHESDDVYRVRMREWNTLSNPPEQGVRESDQDFEIRTTKWVQDYGDPNNTTDKELMKRMSETSLGYKNRVMDFTGRRLKFAPKRHDSESDSEYDNRYSRWRQNSSRPKRRRIESPSEYNLRLMNWLARCKEPHKLENENEADFETVHNEWLLAKQMYGVTSSDANKKQDSDSDTDEETAMLKRIQADSRRRRQSDAPSGIWNTSRLSRKRSYGSHKSFKSAQTLESSDTDEDFAELMRAAKQRKELAKDTLPRDDDGTEKKRTGHEQTSYDDDVQELMTAIRKAAKSSRPQDQLSTLPYVKSSASQDFSSGAFDNIEEERLNPSQFRVKGDGPIFGSIGLNTTISLPGEHSTDNLFVGKDVSRKQSVDDYIDDMITVDDNVIENITQSSLGRRSSLMNFTDKETLEFKLLDLKYSFGYDCTKRSNLHVIDIETVIYIAGNLVVILDLKTLNQKYIHSTSNGGIGSLAVHPRHRIFAVAEIGDAPNIVIYSYPSLAPMHVLRGGTEREYAYVDFNPKGDMLASVGGDPDYMLTLWDWKKANTVLRCKAFSQDVWRISFSADLAGQLTSSGVGHIRFWKMARTFTGLKLEGSLGKFGKTEISDIDGYVELPDGKVLSGCEWGNMILWEGNLIKVEISREGKKPCHIGAIQHIIMDEGELMTIGLDGYIRVWNFETIDSAEAIDEQGTFEMEPMNELCIGHDVQLKSLSKSVDENDVNIWYGQDANGGIWKLDLSFSFTSQAPEKLYNSHAGSIEQVSSSPLDVLVASIGIDSSVIVYDYASQKQLCKAKYGQSGNSLLWLPTNVDPLGVSLLVGYGDGVVRWLVFQKKDTSDGYNTRKTKAQLDQPGELVLKQAFKPHSKPVTHMAIDHSGKILATAGEDNSVFFLKIGDNIEPIGFVMMPSAVTHLTWSPESHKRNTLLVSCENGEILEIMSPLNQEFDTSHTFEITGLEIRTHVFKSVKSHLRRAEELVERDRLEKIRREKEEEERKIRVERGLEIDEIPPEPEKLPEDPWDPYYPPTPSPIQFTRHSQEEGKFWISMGGFDTGYLYECEMKTDAEKKLISQANLYQPIKSLIIQESKEKALTSMTFTSNGEILVFGQEDGVLRIYPLKEPFDLSTMDAYFMNYVHDNQRGLIKSVNFGYNDTSLFSVGKDGNFFSFQLKPDEEIKAAVELEFPSKANLPLPMLELKDKNARDIEDEKAYSIEESKQKSEYDRLLEVAEKKKIELKKLIQKMREEFSLLIEENKKLAKPLRLMREEFEMAPEIRVELNNEIQEQINIVYKKKAFEQEKYRLLLRKLKERYKDSVQCDLIVLHSFASSHKVCSYRITALGKDYHQMKAEITMQQEKTMNRDDTRNSLKNGSTLKQRLAEEMYESEQKRAAPAVFSTTLKGINGERLHKAMEKVEAKKQKREKRRSEWSSLYNEKPPDNYEDPVDVRAIAYAKDNMGDFKLKSSSDYVVPDHLRMNTKKARSRLLEIKELIYDEKTEFNLELRALRDKKRIIIEESKMMCDEINMLQENFDPEDVLEVPVIEEMHPDEEPEKKYEITDEILEEFKLSLDGRDHNIVANSNTKSKLVKKKTEAEIEAFSQSSDSDSDSESDHPQTGAKNNSNNNNSNVEVTSDGEGGGEDEGYGYNADCDECAMSEEDSFFNECDPQYDNFVCEESDDLGEDVPSELEIDIMEKQKIADLYRRDELLDLINTRITHFDADLRCLRHHKFQKDIDMKNADLREVTLFEELQLLKEFEKSENIMEEKVEEKSSEKSKIIDKIDQSQLNLELKKKDIEKLLEKEKQIMSSFISYLGDNYKFAEYLTKVFKKKIKRSKKKDNDDDSDVDSDGDSEDDSDYSESDEESDGENGGLDLDVCPPGCEPAMYENTCQQREKRLDIEDLLVEEKRLKDLMVKELDAYQKKAKIININLKSAENELEDFQLEKQRKLNELDVVVTLRLHQILHYNNAHISNDLSCCLVFESNNVIRLANRIKELEQEKGTQKEEKKEARMKYAQLIKDRSRMNEKISKMHELCDTRMMQKFGKIVNLEVLESTTVHSQLEEQKEKLRISKENCSAEIEKWNQMVEDSNDEVTNLIRENTKLLDQMNMVMKEKKQYENDLNTRQKAMSSSEYSGVRKNELVERKRLVQLVQLQAQEIEALKDEILLLSRKGGHILPPAQPPVPQSAHMRSALPKI